MKKQNIIASIIIIMSFALYCQVEQNGEKKPEPKKEIPPIITQQEAVKLVQSLIKGTAPFSVQLSHPLLPGKIRLWQQRGIIRYPTKQVPWDQFKKNVNEFNTFLHTLLNRNPQTGVYYHIDNVQRNAALINAFKKIEKALARYTPKIAQTATTPFKLDKNSLEALQKLIDTYGTIFYKDKLLSTIKKFTTSFEGEAKKIRTEEETAAQRARTKPATYEPQPDYSLDLGTEFDFTSPAYESETSTDFDIFSSQDIEDDFISSFFKD